MIMMWMNEASGIPIIQDKPRPHRTERKIEGFQTKQYGWEVFQVRDEESGRAANLSWLTAQTTDKRRYSGLVALLREPLEEYKSSICRCCQVHSSDYLIVKASKAKIKLR
ncbi:hypothetical protein ES703_105479 [subsurface metagenome]